MTITPNLTALLEQKFNPLGKLLDGKVELWCEIELERVTPHHSGKIFRAEVNLSQGGTFFRAEATEESIEEAIDVARNELKRELERAHGKRQTLWKRGRQAIKKMLRLSGEGE
jgi:ribosomal subunit interface protein